MGDIPQGAEGIPQGDQQQGGGDYIQVEVEGNLQQGSQLQVVLRAQEGSRSQHLVRDAKIGPFRVGHWKPAIVTHKLKNGLTIIWILILRWVGIAGLRSHLINLDIGTLRAFFALHAVVYPNSDEHEKDDPEANSKTDS